MIPRPFTFLVMHKIVVTILLSLLAYSGFSQSILFFRADTVKIYKNGGYAELMVYNKTRDSTGGLAINAGNGLIKFVKPYKIDDTTIVIGLDTFAIGSGTPGLSTGEVQQLIDDAIAVLDNAFDDSTIIGDGSGSDKRRVNLSLIPTRETTDSLADRVDSIVLNWPLGANMGKTTVSNISTTGDTLVVRVNDSLFNVKRLEAGTNITFTVSADKIIINGVSGSEEINTVTGTLSGTATITVSVESMIDYVLVRPVSNLAGFKIGIAADDDKYFPATPVLATADFVIFDVGAYLTASTPVQFSGVTSSTEIQIIYKPIHE